MTATHTPRISAAVLAAAATRLAGAVVLDVADHLTKPAVYRARLEMFETIEGDELGPDDGTLIVLVLPGTARDLIDEHGTPGRAAAVLNRELAKVVAL
jgi:hypothetical protein